MATLKTISKLTLASLMINTFKGNPTKEILDWQISEILRLLPSGTTLTKLNEKNIVYATLYREFEMEFDCPFFLQNFDFEVEYTRNCISDGIAQPYFFDQATKIVMLP